MIFIFTSKLFILTCVLPDEDGPTSSVNCPWRNPPLSNASILKYRGSNT